MSQKLNPQIGNLNFDQWKHLAENDPKNFELERTKLIESELKKFPPEQQLRLRQLQFRCDGVRRKYKHNGLVSAQKMYDQMQASFSELHQALLDLHRVCDDLEKRSSAKPGLVVVDN